MICLSKLIRDRRGIRDERDSGGTGDRKGPFLDPGHNLFDDNAINAAGVPEFTQIRGIYGPKKRIPNSNSLIRHAKLGRFHHNIPTKIPNLN